MSLDDMSDEIHAAEQLELARRKMLKRAAWTSVAVAVVAVIGAAVDFWRSRPHKCGPNCRPA